MSTDKKYDIIGVGSPIVDLLAHVSDDFISGIEGDKGGMELVSNDTINQLVEKMGGNVVQAPGGSAANTLFALSRLGAQGTILGKIGNCDSADFYKSSYLNTGGCSSRFKVGDVANGRCLSLITPDSERTMRTDLGAAMTLAPNEVTVDDFKNCAHAHIEGYLLFNRDLMQKVLNSARDAGCTISLDLASFEVVNASKDILSDILNEYIDIAFANEDEANAFLGKGDDYNGMALDFAELCEIGVVKKGKDGSCVARNKEVVEIEPIVVEKAIDTTAAGDFWAAGFLHGWINNHSLTDCGRFGSILGAEVVQVMGSAIEDAKWSEIRNQLGAGI